MVSEPMIMLSEFFKKAKNKFEIIVSFMAILELIRIKEIKIRQKKLFSDIEIIRNKNNITPYARR